MALTEDQVQRYARHILLPGVGGRGQEALLAGCVRVRGSGRAAEEAALYLTAGGVGRLILDEELIGRLDERVRALNPDVALARDGRPDADVAFAGDEAGDRLAGAREALTALVALSGAADHAPEWTWETSA